MGSRYDHITLEERHLICRWRSAKVLALAFLADALLFRFHARVIKLLAACVIVALALHGLGV